MTRITSADLTIGKLQDWLQTQPQPTTPELLDAIKKAKRLIRLSREEESE